MQALLSATALLVLSLAPRLEEPLFRLQLSHAMQRKVRVWQRALSSSSRKVRPKQQPQEVGWDR